MFKKIFIIMLLFIFTSSYGLIFPKNEIFKFYDKWDIVDLMLLYKSENNSDATVYQAVDIYYYREIKADYVFKKILNAENIYFSYTGEDLIIILKFKNIYDPEIWILTSKIPNPEKIRYQILPVYLRWQMGRIRILYPKYCKIN